MGADRGSGRIVVLAAVVLFVLVGCGGGSGQEVADTTTVAAEPSTDDLDERLREIESRLSALLDELPKSASPDALEEAARTSEQALFDAAEEIEQAPAPEALAEAKEELFRAFHGLAGMIADVRRQAAQGDLQGALGRFRDFQPRRELREMIQAFREEAGNAAQPAQSIGALDPGGDA